MAVCYIFALSCEIRHCIDEELFDAFQYMTRTKEYDFNPPDHPLFVDSSQKAINLPNGKTRDIPSAWRTLINDKYRGGEEEYPGNFYSSFQNYSLEFRKLVRDDNFFNVWYISGPLLVSVSESKGFVGYYLGNVLSSHPKLTLIYFEGGLVFECLIQLRFEFKENPQSIAQEYQELSTYTEEIPEHIIQEFSFQAKQYNLSIERYIKSAFFYKELAIPQGIQRQWAWSI